MFFFFFLKRPNYTNEMRRSMKGLERKGFGTWTIFCQGNLFLKHVFPNLENTDRLLEAKRLKQ